MIAVADGTVFVIAGPTASGKSRLALALADRIAALTGKGAIIINADSMQVYRGIEILTVQPDQDTFARVPHALYGVLDPTDPCSAGRWRKMALREIATARARGSVPIIVGGTGLYLKALTEGIAPVPDVPAAVRAAVRARLAEIGNEAFRDALAARDPDGAARIRAGDRQRLVRAMEVLEATGKPLAYWQSLPLEGPPSDLRFRIVLLDPPRDALYDAIDARFDRMVEAGALDEARAMVERGIDPDLAPMKALGIAELAAAAHGVMPLEKAVARAKTASRNYAKRQVTWFRRQMIADVVINEKFSERNVGKILSEIL